MELGAAVSAPLTDFAAGAQCNKSLWGTMLNVLRACRSCGEVTGRRFSPLSVSCTHSKCSTTEGHESTFKWTK
ncbi:hypothetical protein CEXT_295021 [Caerostris extrusa]|uniref:Uncharacterized protein n=1 Tax=Caerostris extrusa TaxID=172846 RepID=A0AAV4RUC3_CAEEX|nr:hypothetical protein CEXT_295021 [Caerostris extrusa]